MRILIVLDNHDCACGLTELLAQAGHSADTARTQSRAMAMVTAKPYDLVLLEFGAEHVRAAIRAVIPDARVLFLPPDVLATLFEEKSARSLLEQIQEVL
jgi:DNA-binding response OmpR family regulator